MDCSHQTPLSVEFSRQEYWSRWSFPSPGGLPNPGIELESPTLQAHSLLSEPPGKLTHVSVCVCVCVTQLCLTLCDSMDCSPPGSSVHGILQARIPEWVAISFSRGSSQPRDGTQASCTAGGCYTVCFTAPHVSSLQLNSTEAA